MLYESQLKGNYRADLWFSYAKLSFVNCDYLELVRVDYIGESQEYRM